MIDRSRVIWRKSSQSNANGGQCVEVGVWRKSSLSGGNGGSCVEAASAVDSSLEAQFDGLFLLRDSKDPDGPVLSFSSGEWNAFLAIIKSGRFDALA
ncbi:DUF397 domain-containing protein [Streptosporangium sp. NPDC048047]|uniref:DUF397 domain-containing protein n=1 Tax=Streptosporangium sp. NPDC048047 TaxID=3155748 RepID=UPI003413D23C